MFVFLQLQKPNEEQIQQAHLSLYEQKGIELITQIPNLLQDITGQPISKEFERLNLPDFKNISEFNSYSMQEGDYRKDAPRHYTIIEMKNPEYEQAVQREEISFNSLPPAMQERIIDAIKGGKPPAWLAANSSPDPKMKAWLEANYTLKNAPKDIYIIKNEQTGKILISSKQPSHLSKDGEPVYSENEQFFTYSGEKLKEAFRPEIHGDMVGNYTSKQFADKCNTTTAPAEPKNYEKVEKNGQTFYVKKSAQLEDQVQPEGIMK